MTFGYHTNQWKIMSCIGKNVTSSFTLFCFPRSCNNCFRGKFPNLKGDERGVSTNKIMLDDGTFLLLCGEKKL